MTVTTHLLANIKEKVDCNSVNYYRSDTLKAYFHVKVFSLVKGHGQPTQVVRKKHLLQLNNHNSLRTNIKLQHCIFEQLHFLQHCIVIFCNIVSLTTLLH